MPGPPTSHHPGDLSLTNPTPGWGRPASKLLVCGSRLWCTSLCKDPSTPLPHCQPPPKGSLWEPACCLPAADARAWSLTTFVSAAMPLRKFGSGRSQSHLTHLPHFLCCCCCFSGAKSCLILCDPRDWSMPGFPVLHHPPELAQTHVCGVSDVIQPSYPLSFPSPFTLNLCQHQGLFQ